MEIMYYILGSALILSVIIDLLWTTLWVDGGAGWFTDRLTTSIWKLMRRVDKEVFYNLTGPIILALTLFSWVLLLWIGASLFFSGNPDAIVNSSTNQSIEGLEVAYYSGFTLFTLGVGDYTAQTLLFKIATVLISGIGMLLLTFSASYIISVVGAVVSKRSLARSIMGIGKNSTQFLKNAWNGKDFSQLDLLLSSINSQITELTQLTLAFPLVQYYHSEDVEKTITVAIAVLDEALTILRYGLVNQDLVNITLLKSNQSSIKNYLDTSISGYGDQVEGIDEIPDVMNLLELNKIEIPLWSQEKYSKRIQEIENRRNELLTIVTIDNHKWPNDK